MNILEKLIVYLLKCLFGIYKPIKIGNNKIYCPLFYNYNGRLEATWDILNKDKQEIKFVSEYIKSGCPKGFQPSITFLLSPADEAGNITDKNLVMINNDNLNKAIEKIQYFLDNGIAIFPCLYTDDKSPDWRDIGKHINIWKTIHNKIKDYVSGYLLSIESNERFRNINILKDCLITMKSHLTDVEIYTTHLQYNSTDYRWLTENQLFNELEYIFVETSWQPTQGNNIDINRFSAEIDNMINNNKSKKLVIMEYNTDLYSEKAKQQRMYLINKTSLGGIG